VIAWAWLLPNVAALLGMTAWSPAMGSKDRAAVSLALASLALPVPGALAVSAAALALARPSGRWSASGAALVLALLRARSAYLPTAPERMLFWGALLPLVLVMASSQALLAAEDADDAGRALARGQAAWLLFGLLSPAPLGWSGALLLLWQQPLLRQPLSAVLDRAPGRVFLAGLLFLGLAGGPLLSGFNAYFQLLAPFMTEGALVQTMQAKLYTGTGLIAVLATLALLYQTGAFGYFYWSRVLPAAPSEAAGTAHWRPVPMPWAWACLGLSLAWGLAEHWGGPGRLALLALESLHALPLS
jgi:hypothetical protein